MSYDELRAAVLALPEGDRLKLADELYGSVATDDVPLSPAQMAELDRRWKRHQENPGAAIPGDEFFRRLKAKYGS